jgi:hypothetical protein
MIGELHDEIGGIGHGSVVIPARVRQQRRSAFANSLILLLHNVHKYVGLFHGWSRPTTPFENPDAPRLVELFFPFEQSLPRPAPRALVLRPAH